MNNREIIGRENEQEVALLDEEQVGVQSITSFNPRFLRNGSEREAKTDDPIHIDNEHNVMDEESAAQIAEATALDEAGQYEEMLRVAEQVSTMHPGSAEALACKARALQKLQRISEATIANDQALLLDTNLPLAWLNRSGLQLLQERFQEALRSTERAVALAPQDARTWVNKGLALLNLNYLIEALAAFDASLALEPDFLFALQLKGEALRSLGWMQDAVPVVRRALEIDADNVAVLTLAIRVFSAIEDYAALPALTGRLVQLTPDDFFARESHMRALRSAGRFEEALTAIEDILELEPGNVHFWTLKADSLYRLGRYRQAATAADHALHLNADYPPARRIHEKAVRLMYQHKGKKRPEQS